jgi:futalosine hydrolase
MVGPFITVNGVSGNRKRGEMLRKKWQGLRENMEGAAVVRVCREFDLPCLELRCISNMVEDRDLANWRVAEACDKAALAAILTIKGLVG